MSLPGGQSPSYGAQYPGGSNRPPPLLWALIVAAVVVVCAVALVAGLSFTAGKVRDAQGQSRQEATKPGEPARPRVGGPFLDPISTLPQTLWTVSPDGLAPGRSLEFAAANQDTVLVTSSVSFTDHMYAFIALDAKTGAKKWTVQAKLATMLTNCALSGDSQVMCWRDNPLDTSSFERLPPNTTQLMFVSSKDGSVNQMSLSSPGEAVITPLRDGFLVFKNPYGGNGASMASAFSSSGEQRWKAQGVGGNADLSVADNAGLFSIGNDDTA